MLPGKQLDFYARWAVRLVCLALLLWIVFKPDAPAQKTDERIILEYEIAVLQKNDSILEIVKHENINRIDSLPDDSVKRIITKWLERSR